MFSSRFVSLSLLTFRSPFFLRHSLNDNTCNKCSTIHTTLTATVTTSTTNNNNNETSNNNNNNDHKNTPCTSNCNKSVGSRQIFFHARFDILSCDLVLAYALLACQTGVWMSMDAWLQVCFSAISWQLRNPSLCTALARMTKKSFQLPCWELIGFSFVKARETLLTSWAQFVVCLWLYLNSSWYWMCFKTCLQKHIGEARTTTCLSIRQQWAPSTLSIWQQDLVGVELNVRSNVYDSYKKWNTS